MYSVTCLVCLLFLFLSFAFHLAKSMPCKPGGGCRGTKVGGCLVRGRPLFFFWITVKNTQKC